MWLYKDSLKSVDDLMNLLSDVVILLTDIKDEVYYNNLRRISL